MRTIPSSIEAKKGKTAIDADDQVVSVAEVRALKKQIHQLERALGKKTMEVDILRR